MNILAWLIFGLIVGTIANILDPRPSIGGVLGSIFLSIVGSFVGGILATAIFGLGISGFNLSTLAVAVLGSMLVLMVQRLLIRDTGRDIDR